ncbi:hypothetical protein FA15DRAFT_703514 [Coprinopsis marcescibilis]|uniref:Uncharacterized protein n=1 Tax=Coprinopsis marcescibilis TaxID=230819 RepID=A0A5C3KYS7_COPMA|nr:hypothetical protein FA15DRAFT_703514 [Coprinopsis marcescibilis]
MKRRIFLIYTNLKGTSSGSEGPAAVDLSHGLGYVDSSKGLLEISFDLSIPESSEGNSEDISQTKVKSKSKRLIKRKNVKISAKTVEVQLFQDITSLRSRKGDTGSVVWKASVEFAHLVLSQHHFNVENSLFDFDRLKASHILELGSGTGLLGVLISPLSGRYTVTDIQELVPLIQKNVTKNLPGSSNITAESLDWIALRASSPLQRNRLFRLDNDPDLILVVDCIYHPSLIAPLISTLDHFAVPLKTHVLVLSELRSEDVLRDFLSSWLEIPGWKIHNVGEKLLRNRRYVMWIGVKSAASKGLT